MLNKDQLTIRPTHPDDAADLYAVIAAPQVVMNLNGVPSMEFSETEKWIQEPKPGQHRLVAELNGRVVGSINITQFQNPRRVHSGSLGIMVHPDYWGQGVGSALMAGILNVADNWLNLLRVELDVYSHNTAAIHLYEKFGFEREGVKRQEVFGDGRYFDTHAMARLRHAEWYANQPPSPSPTRPLKSHQPAQAIIRPPRFPDDVDGLHFIFRQAAVSRTTMQLPSQEISKTRDRLKNVSPGLYRYVADVDGRVVGMASLYQKQSGRERHAASLGMMVHPDYWGQHIGSQLMEALMKLADNWLHFTRVELEVNTDNPAAVRLYEKFGFEIEGTYRMHVYGDGRMADSYFMGRVR